MEFLLASFSTLTISYLFFTSSSPFPNRLGLLRYAVFRRILYLEFGRIWYYFSRILVFLGGVLIQFNYASSCSSNFRFYGMRICKALIFALSSFISEHLITFKTQGCTTFSVKSSLEQPTQEIQYVIGISLLITLFVVVKLSRKGKGPIKSKKQ